MDIEKYHSKWTIKEDEQVRIRFAIFEPDNGKIMLTTLEDKRKSTKEHWIDIKLWNYEKMIEMRKKAQKYHLDSRSFYIDQDILNDLKLKELIIDWSFGHEDPHMKLHHVNGILTDESLKIIKSLYPWVLEHIINKINLVLEGINLEEE